MKVAVIGITGRVGSRLATELLSRGHQVTGIARDISKVAPQADLTLKQGDATDAAALAPLLAGHDVVISSTNFAHTNAATLISAVKQAGGPRLLVVGGAGSLEVAPGVALVDTPEFPALYKVEATAGRDFLNMLRQELALDWTFLSPSALFEPGARTGQFRLGTDQLLVDGSGKSWISMEDYAIAMVDELEHPKHLRSRFTVGY